MCSSDLSNVASAVANYRQESEGTSYPTCPSINEIQNSLGVALGALTRLNAMSVAGATVIITATITAIDTRVDGSTLTLTPTENADGSITWAWGGSIAPSYMPKR